MDIISLKPSLLKQALKVCILANRPVFLWGSPGIGKSDVIRQIANELKRDLRDIRATLLDPVDLRGLPTVNNGKVQWAIPGFLPDYGSNDGIMFFDELNAAPSMTQAAFYQLILDRSLGEYSLPNNWAMVAAGNLESDKAITHKMSTALKSRFVHLQFEVDHNDWISWSLANNVYTPIIAFLRFRPDLLHKFDSGSKDNSFPCPRTWKFVSDLLIQGIPKEIELPLIAGTIGQGAAIELVAFLQIFRELPNPDTVLLNPDKAIIPEKPSVLYALCGALSKKASDNNIDRFVKYANRLPKEFGVLMVTDALKRNADLANSRAVIEWFSINADVQI